MRIANVAFDSSIASSDPLLGITDAVRETGYSETYLRRHADWGILSCVRTVGGHRLFKLSDLRACRRRRTSTRTRLAA